MDFLVLTSKILASIGERGVAGTTRAAGRHLWRKLRGTPVDDFDQRHGTDTSGELALWEMRVSSPSARFGRRYQASTEGELVQVVNGLGIDTKNFTFVDLGCGKGRTLLVAAQLGFGQVVGVELSGDLADIARANLAKLDVANGLVIHGDAGEYVFPSGALLVYFYNPFGAPVMRHVVDELEHRIEQGAADEIFVVYKGPACAPLLDQSKFLRRVDSARGPDYIAIWKGMGR